MYKPELFNRVMTGIRGQSPTHEHHASSAVPHPPKLQSVSEGHAGKTETSARLRLRVLLVLLVKKTAVCLKAQNPVLVVRADQSGPGSDIFPPAPVLLGVCVTANYLMLQRHTYSFVKRIPEDSLIRIKIPWSTGDLPQRVEYLLSKHEALRLIREPHKPSTLPGILPLRRWSRQIRISRSSM